jgi:hypothetical protein
MLDCSDAPQRRRLDADGSGVAGCADQGRCVMRGQRRSGRRSSAGNRTSAVKAPASGPSFKGSAGYRPTDRELAWIAAHPEAANAWLGRDRLLVVSMCATFVVGFLGHLAGYGLETGRITLPDWLPEDLVGSMLTDLGLVLWTSVFFVLFLEYLPDIAARRAARYGRLAVEDLRERGIAVSQALAVGGEAPAGPSAEV